MSHLCYQLVGKPTYLIFLRDCFLKLQILDGGRTHQVTISNMNYNKPIGEIWQESSLAVIKNHVDDATAKMVNLFIKAEDSTFTTGCKIKDALNGAKI